MLNQKTRIGDLVWIPEHSTLVWALKKDKLVKRILKTVSPKVALVISEFDDKSYCVFLDEDYWIIDKNKVYEVPDVSDTRSSQ